jgi:hypothetical protein
MNLARALPWLVAALLTPSALLAQASEKQCQPHDLDKLSGWNGVWIGEGLESDISGREPDDAPSWVEHGVKLLGLNAPWNDEGWSRMLAVFNVGASGTVQKGWGFPMMMSVPAPFRIFITPTETVITSQYREIRYIPTDGRPHTPEEERWPTNWGDSIGCWEGDTLVIDTVSVAYAPDFNFFAPPLSEEARFVERLRLTAPDRLESDITITDPKYLEKPWHVHMVYLRHSVLQRLVHEGDMGTYDRLVVDDGRPQIVEPPPKPRFEPRPYKSVKLDAAELDRLVGHYTVENTPLTLQVERRDQRLVLVWGLGGKSVSLPLLPEAALDFITVGNGRFRFTTDASGTVTGVEGNLMDGRPFKGKPLSKPPVEKAGASQ